MAMNECNMVACPLSALCDETNRCLAAEFKAAGFSCVMVNTTELHEETNGEPPLTDVELIKLRRHMALWPL